MIVSHICGGLGNQLFQYAMAFSLSKKLNLNLILDISNYQRDNKRRFLLDLFNIPELQLLPLGNEFGIRYSERLIKYGFYKLGCYPRWQWIKEHKNRQLEIGSLNLSKNLYLEGYWQNVSYFGEFSEEIRNLFKTPCIDFTKYEALIGSIKNKNSICIHIRRGDYVSSIPHNKRHKTLSVEYYFKGIEQIHSKVESPSFYVFSDDPEWVKNHLILNEKDITFISVDEKNNSDLYEFFLMMKCKHFIIANSTYSWWVAWLSTESPDKNVIFPVMKNGISPISPPDWYGLKVNNEK